MSVLCLAERPKMNKATPAMREFARRLLELEAKESKPAEASLPVAIRVCEKLRSLMSGLMGKTGFQALLARSLTIGAGEAPWLGTLSLGPDGAWQGLQQPIALEAQAGAEEGGIVLLARLLGLLTAFIGAHLTVQLVREIWPEFPSHDLDLESGDSP